MEERHKKTGRSRGVEESRTDEEEKKEEVD